MASGSSLIDLPAKKTNEQEFNNASSVDIVTNAFRLNIDDSVRQVHTCELKFFTKYANGRERDITRGPKNDVSNEVRRKLLWELFQTLIASDDAFFGNHQDRKAMYAYDCGINFYSIRKLMDEREQRDFSIPVDLLSDEGKSYIGRRVEGIVGRLLATGSFDVHSKTAIDAGADRSVTQFLEVLSSQMMYSEGKHHLFPQKAYEKGSALALQRVPHVLKSGMQKNVRMVGDGPDDTTPVVQLYLKKAAFFPSGPLGAFLEQILPGAEPLHKKIFDEKNFRMAVKQVRNLVVRTNHLDFNITFAVNGLTKKGADEVELDCDGDIFNVAEYYRSKYSIIFRYKNLPCVVYRRVARVGEEYKKVESYWPIEVLEIIDGQRVPLEKQTPSLMEQMILQCQSMPRDFKNLMEDQREKASITSRNPYFRAFGVCPGKEANARCRTSALSASHPVWQERSEPVNGHLDWKLPPQRRFLTSAKVPKTWAAVIFDRGVEDSRDMDFITRLVKAANDRYFLMNMPNRYDNFDDTSSEFLRERLNHYQENQCEYVLFFTRDRLDSVHHTMKLFETELDIVTQHICAATVEKGIGHKGARLVLDNVLMKMHEKLGGVNHDLSTARSMQKSNPSIRGDIVAENWFTPKRMYIGIELAHAGSQSLYERQSGQSVTEPTVIGYAYTCGQPAKLRGTYWFQEPRETIVQDLTRHLKESIEKYEQDTRCSPESIILYRSGLGEGEYRKAITAELAQIKKAFEELEAAHPSFSPPPVTIVVTQRQSNYRIVPQRINPNGKAFEQNVPAGTVVDKAIMHPSLTEFLMVSHKSIRGTARPVRYTVLVDEEHISLTQLEYITYHLCYTHGVGCSSVSVPGSLYAAGELAKRGRNNWKEFNQQGLAPTNEGGDHFRPEGSLTFLQECSDMLKPTLHTKFWA
ncbi:NRDE-3 protein [Aphelenchoides avenae]|nr:NRDE-3 protein [Aphelenchus avenae]